MGRLDPRVLVLLPVLLIAGGCGDDDQPAQPPPVTTPSLVPSLPVPSLPVPSQVPDPNESIYVEEPEDPDPTIAPGDLSDAAQAQLDEALGTELGALEGASPEVAAPRRKILDGLPEDPRQVLAALKNYVWYSPEARALYDKAVKTG
jgi:hypothetical protein